MFDPKIPFDLAENLERMKQIRAHHERQVEGLERREEGLKMRREAALKAASAFKPDEGTPEAENAYRIVRKYDFDLSGIRRSLQEKRGKLAWAMHQIEFLELEMQVKKMQAAEE